jgi:hypothetical protein
MRRRLRGERCTPFLALAIVCQIALVLFAGCESGGAPTEATETRLFEADPAFPDSSVVPPQNPLPGLDDPTQPHP